MTKKHVEIEVRISAEEHPAKGNVCIETWARINANKVVDPVYAENEAEKLIEGMIPKLKEGIVRCLRMKEPE